MRRLAWLAIAGALLAAACSNGTAAETTTTGPNPTTTTSTTVPVTATTTTTTGVPATTTTTEPPPAASPLDPATIPKYQVPLLIPPVMPTAPEGGTADADYYEIAVRQFSQQVLPAGFPQTMVWGYGAVAYPETFHFPSFTIEARWQRPVTAKWTNELVRDPVDCFHTAGGPADSGSCDYLPHLLAVDQTIHWANPSGDCRITAAGTDCPGNSADPYTGPVPMVVHLHGGEVDETSDGFPEAWYLPAAGNIPEGYAAAGSLYSVYRAESPMGDSWEPGSAVFTYPNDQPATTLWYHDHSMGMTRLNVYAGPAGFYLLRGGSGDELGGTLPGPAPAAGDAPGLAYREIPIAIQDRSFRTDGSLYYPDNRAFFEGLEPDALEIPFLPSEVSDISPIWNPEFFGNAIVVNGNTWPYMQVEPVRYRLRLLDGTQGRFLILRLVTATDPADPATWQQVPGAFWQIGAEQGFLPEPVQLDELLMGPAERADVIVDFGAFSVPTGAGLYLVNVGPDEPYGGGVPGEDFAPADPTTTGQIMEFRLVAANGEDPSTPPEQLVLPALDQLPEAADMVRTLSLNEAMSMSVFVIEDEEGRTVAVPEGTDEAEPFGPAQARLGVLNADGTTAALAWADAITENIAAGSTEIWEIYNFTADAHPIHLHLVQFQVVDRQALATDEDGEVLQPVQLVGTAWPAEAWETGYKDTVIAYPGEVTRIKARFPLAGLYVWHCHIVEHEDNEMMRPFCVGAGAACALQGSGGGM